MQFFATFIIVAFSRFSYCLLAAPPWPTRLVLEQTPTWEGIQGPERPAKSGES